MWSRLRLSSRRAVRENAGPASGVHVMDTIDLLRTGAFMLLRLLENDGRIPAKHCLVFLFQHVRIREPKRSHSGTFLAAKPKTPSFSMVTV
jgi:hypothetical protein